MINKIIGTVAAIFVAFGAVEIYMRESEKSQLSMTRIRSSILQAETMIDCQRLKINDLQNQIDKLKDKIEN